MKTEQMWMQCRGNRLYAELFVPDVVPAPALLICHGLNARGSNGLTLYARLAEKARKSGFVSLVFDFRGTGRSMGRFDYGFGEQEDVKCALDFLSSRPEVLTNVVFVVGHSLGGAVSIYALQDETRVKGLVLWSTPKNHDYNVKKFIRRTRGKLGLYLFFLFSYIDKVFDVSRLFRLEVYEVALRLRFVREKLMKLRESEAIARLRNMPVLVVVGDSDNIVGVDEAEEIYRSANEPKNLLVISGADHIYKGKEQELIDRTIQWIEKMLNSQGGTNS